MTKADTIHNSKCLKDDKVLPEMVKVGPMTFCNECFTEEFGEVYDNGEVPFDSEEYKKWLEVYKETLGNAE